MKKFVLGVLMLSVMSTSAQKKHKNGKIYDQHPGIEIVNEFTKAFVAGDEEKLKSLVTEDFKWWQMNSMEPKPLKINTVFSKVQKESEFAHCHPDKFRYQSRVDPHGLRGLRKPIATNVRGRARR